MGDYLEPAGDEIERVLIDGLRTEPLSDAAMQRLHDRALREWQASGRQHSVRRFLGYRIWAVAAALACVALGATWLFRTTPAPAAFGRLERAGAGDCRITESVLYHHRPEIGGALKSGGVLTCRGPALIALAVGGTLRVAPDSVLKLDSATQMTLQSGRIYLDFPPGGPGGPGGLGGLGGLGGGSGSLSVRTWAGTIDHVGTEFEVLSNQQVVRIRVREGRVQLRSESGRTLLDAGTQLTANADGSVVRKGIESYGEDWSWVAQLAPDYEIEGQPLLNFLQWAARELGRPVKFSDPHAREVAEHTILHGSVKGREPMDALSTVLSTTSLTYEIRGDTIWIKSYHGI